MPGQFVKDPWFWAFLATIGWALGISLVATRSLGRRLEYGLVMFILAELPRLVLPLPFVSQPRMMLAPLWSGISGAIILLGSLVFAWPVFTIVPLTAPDHSEPLRTSGFYAWVRHPLMLCDIFWPLGWSLLFGSWIGTLLTPIWFTIILVLTYVEEEALVREYGDAYRQFQSRVPRLFPRLFSKFSK